MILFRSEVSFPRVGRQDNCIRFPKTVAAIQDGAGVMKQNDQYSTP